MQMPIIVRMSVNGADLKKSGSTLRNMRVDSRNPLDANAVMSHLLGTTKDRIGVLLLPVYTPESDWVLARKIRITGPPSAI